MRREDRVIPKEALPPPPNLAPGNTLKSRLLYSLRTLLDLQITSVLRALKPWLAGLKGNVLEVGCGAQPYRHLIPGSCAYLGLDWYMAQAVFGYRAEDLVYFDGRKFPLKEGSFDNLFHTEVLEHINDPFRFLRECHRVLKPGGSLFFSVPFQARYHYIPHDYWRFTPAGLEILLAGAGFSDWNITPRGNDIVVAAYKVFSLGFRWLSSQGRLRLLGLIFAPVAGLALMAGHLFLRLSVGSPDDCLGYNVRARKPLDDPQSHTASPL
ncbi:MAG: class I SAM-dependent methyltransferase [Desulfobaccales bacterium]